jgi:hypothetical protein
LFFIEGNILENLIHQYGTLDENGSRTIDNYATRKFHLNSFMNVVSQTDVFFNQKFRSILIIEHHLFRQWIYY